MKILKPGKVEMRKFVCPDCGCEFIAAKLLDVRDGDCVACPQDGCYHMLRWADGEPYEEPTPTQTDKERSYGILLTANPNATTTQLTDHLIANGVAFREG